MLEGLYNISDDYKFINTTDCEYYYKKHQKTQFRINFTKTKPDIIQYNKKLNNYISLNSSIPNRENETVLYKSDQDDLISQKPSFISTTIILGDYNVPTLSLVKEKIKTKIPYIIFYNVNEPIWIQYIENIEKDLNDLIVSFTKLPPISSTEYTRIAIGYFDFVEINKISNLLWKTNRNIETIENNFYYLYSNYGSNFNIYINSLGFYYELNDFFLETFHKEKDGVCYKVGQNYYELNSDLLKENKKELKINKKIYSQSGQFFESAEGNLPKYAMIDQHSTPTSEYSMSTSSDNNDGVVTTNGSFYNASQKYAYFQTGTDYANYCIYYNINEYYNSLYPSTATFFNTTVFIDYLFSFENITNLLMYDKLTQISKVDTSIDNVYNDKKLNSRINKRINVFSKTNTMSFDWDITDEEYLFKNNEKMTIIRKIIEYDKIDVVFMNCQLSNQHNYSQLDATNQLKIELSFEKIIDKN